MRTTVKHVIKIIVAPLALLLSSLFSIVCFALFHWQWHCVMWDAFWMSYWVQWRLSSDHSMFGLLFFSVLSIVPNSRFLVNRSSGIRHMFPKRVSFPFIIFHIRSSLMLSVFWFLYLVFLEASLSLGIFYSSAFQKHHCFCLLLFSNFPGFWGIKCDNEDASV